MSELVSHSPLALIGNPQEWSARSLDSILVPKGYSVLRAITSHELLEKARLVQPDVVILDIALPGQGGIEVCRQLRAAGDISVRMPILITSSNPVTREVRVEALRAGAWDCVTFPLDAEILSLKLDAFREAKALSEAVREPRLVDPVTGFYTEQGLLGRVRELAAQAVRFGRPLSCVAVGPYFGQAGSDPTPPLNNAQRFQVLQQLAGVLRTNARSSDSIGRLGELEFLVLTPDTDAPGALRLAKRLLQTASTARQPDGLPFSVRAGCFAVPHLRHSTLEPVEIVLRATVALRLAQAGQEGDAVRFFEQSSAFLAG